LGKKKTITDAHMDPLSIFKKAKKSDVNRRFLASLRNNVIQYMDAYPAEAAERLGFAQRVRRFAMVPAIIGGVAAVAVGGSVFAAQGSLPGSPLYPVKLLSEQVTLAATFSPEAKSEEQLSFAAKRVQEVSKLAEESASGTASGSDNYSAAMQAALNNFRSQVSGAFAEANDLKEKNNASGSLAITDKIKAATDKYNAMLVREAMKSNSNVSREVGRFIDTNNGFNARASGALTNASGTGDVIFSGSGGEGNGRGGRIGSSSGAGTTAPAFQIPTSTTSSTDAGARGHGRTGHQGGHGGERGTGGEH
jgi:hypothetical protein